MSCWQCGFAFSCMLCVVAVERLGNAMNPYIAGLIAFSMASRCKSIHQPSFFGGGHCMVLSSDAVYAAFCRYV